MSNSNNQEAAKTMIADFTYEEKLRFYELLLTLRQNQQDVASLQV